TNSDDDENDDQNGGGVDSSSLKSLIDRLTSLKTPMSSDAASKLISTYGEQPVLAWLDVLEHDPTVRSVPALLTHKLRAGETPPPKPQRSRQRSDGNNQASTISRKPSIDPANDYTPEEIKIRRERMREHSKRRQEERAQAERRSK
ncbi:MAG: hypothetical protein GY832_10160, partial [Chloroflexi bacterium]|nr:hypothetical protein [Chloroflexota bacterium]